MKQVIRVGVNANFNCTDAEFNQLQGFKLVRPDAHFFVNSNINTPDLLEINNHDVGVVVTVNPDIKVSRKAVERLYSLDATKVVFVRVKYVPENKAIKALVRELSGKGYKVMITAMRFLGKKTVNKYAQKEWYDWECSWFRLNKERFAELENFADSTPNVYICDRKGLGCSACGYCAKFSHGEDLPLYSLNMSASGLCPFNCVDCYAKKMQYVLVHFGKSPMRFDLIRQNDKQAGRTAHIKAKRAS